MADIESDKGSVISSIGINSAKRYDRIMASTPPHSLGSIKLLTLLLLSIAIFVALIGLLNYILTYLIISFAKENKNKFVAASNLIKLDTNLRRSSNILSMDLITLYGISSESYTSSLYPPAQRGPRLAVLNNRVATTRKVYGTSNFLEFMIRRRDNLNTCWKKTVENQMITLEQLADSSSGISLMKLIDSIGGKITNYNNTNVLTQTERVSYIAFIKYSLNRADYYLDFMKQLRPVMNDKEPPFGITLRDYLNVVYNMALKGVKDLQNIFEGIMNEVEVKLVDIEILILEDDFRSYKSMINIQLAVICVTVALFVFTMLACGKFINRHLNSIISVYHHMKQEELEHSLELSQHSYRKLKDNMFNEILLLEQYTRRDGILSRSMLSAHAIQAPKQTKKNKFQLKRYNKKFRLDFNFPGTLGFLAFKILMLVVICISLILVYSVQKTIDMNAVVERIYFESFKKLIPVSNNFLAYNLFVIYGNYIKIDGKYLEDYKDNDSARNFRQFWTQERHNLKSILPEEDANQVIKLLFGNVCDEFDKTDYYRVYFAACKEYVPTMKGFLAFLQQEQDTIQSLRDQVYLEPAFLNSSKTTITGRPAYLSTFFSDEIHRMNTLHDAITEIFIDRLFQTMESVLTANFNYIDSVLGSIAAATAVVLVLIILVSFIVTFRLISANTQVCRETFAIILPETIFNNPLIYNAFERHFIKQR